MRVKYQTKTVRKTFSTNGGSDAERNSFIQDVVNELIDMGAPLDAELLVDFGTEVGVPFIGEPETEMGGACICIYMGSSANDTKLSMNMMVIGRGEQEALENAFEMDEVIIGDTNSKMVEVIIHAVKSGDSFFFGMVPAGGGTSDGCIDCAITPMRRLSDPSVSLGYAMVIGAKQGGPDEFIGGYFNRTLPLVEGFNYMQGMFTFTTAGYIHAFPETDTGKIPLVPYFAGIEDIYYDKVYVSPMRRGSTEEKMFETDKGTFLIAGGYGTDFTQEFHNTFAFDITEAVNTAQ